jgi:hypothetical protein
MMHGFSTFKILPRKAKLLETHGHDLVLLFRLPNLPLQDILRILGSCSEQSDNFLAIHRHPLRFALHHFTRFLMHDALELQE